MSFDWNDNTIVFKMPPTAKIQLECTKRYHMEQAYRGLDRCNSCSGMLCELKDEFLAKLIVGKITGRLFQLFMEQHIPNCERCKSASKKVGHK